MALLGGSDPKPRLHRGRVQAVILGGPRSGSIICAPQDPFWVELLVQAQVATHEFVIAELALGSISGRTEFLAHLRDLPMIGTITHDEIMSFIEVRLCSDAASVLSMRISWERHASFPAPQCGPRIVVSHLRRRTSVCAPNGRSRPRPATAPALWPVADATGKCDLPRRGNR